MGTAKYLNTTFVFLLRERLVEEVVLLLVEIAAEAAIAATGQIP
jgi:hypothetical protein